MFHQTPSDTSDADAGHDMAMLFEPQHGCQAWCEISWLLNRGRNVVLNWPLKISKLSW